MKNIKRLLIVGALVLTIGAGSLMAHADSPIRIPSNRMANMNMEEREDWIRGRNEISPEEREEWIKERNEFRKDEIKRALENKEITEAEAREWEEHFSYMEEFHNKHRDSNFMGRGHGGRGMGRGMGMMRGNGCRSW